MTFLDATGMPTEAAGIPREHVEAFIVHLIDANSPATALNRFSALQQLFKWLAEEGEISEWPMARMKRPKVDEVEIAVVPDADLHRLLDACKGSAFEDRRDTALVLFLLDTGARASEAVGLEVTDLDLTDYEVATVSGKGGRWRSLPMSPATLKAVDRYLRVRVRHQLANRPELWLGRRGPLTYSGLRQMLMAVAGGRNPRSQSPPVPPHIRSFLLSAGGSETDLMRLAGWRSRVMVSRYAAIAGAERARQAHRKYSPVERLL